MRSKINDFRNNFDDIKSSLVKKKNYTDVKVKTLNKHVEIPDNGLINITVDANVGLVDGEEVVIEKKSVDNMVQAIAKSIVDNTKDNMVLPRNVIISSSESLIDDVDLMSSANYDDVDLSIISLFKPKKSINDLLIDEELRGHISRILTIHNNFKRASEILNMKPYIKGAKSIICNFYGKEGIGKATVAKAIAKEIGKIVVQFSYNELKATEIEEIPKKIKAIFNYAKKKDAVVIITDADSLIRDNNTTLKIDSVHLDIIRCIIKEEIIKLNTMVFFICKDNKEIIESFKSVILMDIKFSLPDEEQREKLWTHYIGDKIELSPIVNPRRLAQKFKDVTLLEIKSILFLATCIAVEEYRDRNILYERDFDTAYEQVKSIY